MQPLLRSTWFKFWLIFYIAAPLISFVGGFGFFFILSIIFPLGQCILLSHQTASNAIWLWLLQVPLWFFFFYSQNLSRMNDNHILIVAIISAALGELVLALSFKSFGRMLWFISSIFSLLIAGYFMKIAGSNDFFQILMAIISWGIGALISAAALYYGFLNSTKAK